MYFKYQETLLLHNTKNCSWQTVINVPNSKLCGELLSLSVHKTQDGKSEFVGGRLGR